MGAQEEEGQPLLVDIPGRHSFFMFRHAMVMPVVGGGARGGGRIFAVRPVECSLGAAWLSRISVPAGVKANSRVPGAWRHLGFPPSQRTFTDVVGSLCGRRRYRARAWSSPGEARWRRRVGSVFAEGRLEQSGEAGDGNYSRIDVVGTQSTAGLKMWVVWLGLWLQ
jgi:hypothetical protein